MVEERAQRIEWHYAHTQHLVTSIACAHHVACYWRIQLLWLSSDRLILREGESFTVIPILLLQPSLHKQFRAILLEQFHAMWWYFNWSLSLKAETCQGVCCWLSPASVQFTVLDQLPVVASFASSPFCATFVHRCDMVWQSLCIF